MVALDTDVLVLAFAFHRDERQQTNARFLEAIGNANPITTIYSVMELLGKLSFNLPPERLPLWPIWLQDRFRLTVAYPSFAGIDGKTFFQQEFVDGPLMQMQQRRMPFLDALILGLVEGVDGVNSFVTWNARHFRGRTTIPVFTPAEYLDQ